MSLFLFGFIIYMGISNIRPYYTRHKKTGGYEIVTTCSHIKLSLL